MDEVELVRAVRPPAKEPSSGDRAAARSRLDGAVEAATGRRIPGSRIGRMAVAAGVVAFLLAAGTMWPAPSKDRAPLDSAVAIVFPDGSKLTTREITRYLAKGRTEELRARLSEYGVRLSVEEIVVHPDAVGRLFGWAYYPGEGQAAREFDSDWYVDEDDEGAMLTVQFGRAPRSGEAPSDYGRLLFDVFPELCEAIVPDDLAATDANLEAQGFAVKWSVLDGHPDEPDYSGSATMSHQAPDEGVIYSILAGDGSPYATEDTKKLWIEIVPGDDPDRPGPGAHYRPSSCG